MTGVSERSQQSSSLKDEGYISVHNFARDALAPFHKYRRCQHSATQRRIVDADPYRVLSARVGSD
ncbi:hypothetical protein [Photorhabdus heterorhabditis]|uniref:Uncharacterized protein n=1 Tax=Photorhabdus heterorhabditis TaxID=880156 RepID=A0A5B0WKG3_9GAMM|nr:hypothetical protein [Photorhabdus heterorhabditis]KAA1186439.1 hypothetical protein F0L16_14000 [Photorhabdus heterorhabditis]